ncbi:MAG: flagellar motor switch protein FliN [Candidatus Marinimicrobia bacterium]|nr:flagellar motor switch protein FliN [Candidatus Neomarinimicrobiota bacterium]
MLLDVELDVTVELGRKIMLVEEILRLGKGSVVELDKLAGEPVDILVNGKKLAEGEVVVVEDHFGVRLTNLINPRERIRSLGKA